MIGGQVSRPTPRKDATARGDKTYHGSVCKRDATHGTLRRSNNSQCVVCKKEYAEWYAAVYRKTDNYKKYQRQYQAKYRNDPAKKEILQRADKKWKAKIKANQRAIG